MHKTNFKNNESSCKSLKIIKKFYSQKFNNKNNMKITIKDIFKTKLILWIKNPNFWYIKKDNYKKK